MNPNIPIPAEAEERSWQLVSEAFVSRIPNRSVRRRRRVVPAGVVVAVIALVVAAVALSANNSRVIVSIRRAIGVPTTTTTLMQLPTAGRVLVNADSGPWIVNADGSTRHLGTGRSQASWSPHGLYEAVLLNPHTLAAIDPRGTIRWTLASRQVSDPRWSGDGYRIAYRSGTTLRIVAGDGTGDRQLATRVAPLASAWEDTGHRLAYLGTDRRVHLIDADNARTIWRSPILPPVVSLAWQPTVGNLVAATGHTLRFLDLHTGKLEKQLALGGDTRALAIAANGSIAVTLAPTPRQSSIELITTTPAATHHRVLFRGAGAFDNLNWSPNSRWLLASWPTADQWLFINPRAKAGAAARVQAIATVSHQFDTDTFPQLAGWCCSGQPEP